MRLRQAAGHAPGAWHSPPNLVAPSRPPRPAVAGAMVSTALFRHLATVMQAMRAVPFIGWFEAPRQGPQ